MKQVKTAMYAQMFYMLGMGLGFLLMPNFVLPLFGFEQTHEVWIRVLGALAAGFSYYYYVSIQHEYIPFAWATVWMRYAFCFVLAILGFLKMTQPAIFLFAALETGLAVWAHIGLKKLNA
jgi:hypothetical protein